MATMLTERRMNLLVMTLGIGAAFFLLDQQVPAWLRILPWILVFGYPLARMFRSRRLGRRE
jgi:hypothetical protein